MNKITLWVAGISIGLLLFSCDGYKNPDMNKKTTGTGAVTGHISDIMDTISILKVNESAPKLIGKDWMMVSAGDSSSFNTMTISWGSLGELWGRPIATVFIRPQRHTFGFMENNEYFTLSVFDENYRAAYNIIGTRSGRDGDKIAEAGITPMRTDNGMAFREARMVIECRKIYADFLKADAFIDSADIKKWYPEADYHKMYIGEIVNVWTK